MSINAMHAKPDLRVVLKMEDRWFGLDDPNRYTPNSTADGSPLLTMLDSPP